MQPITAPSFSHPAPPKVNENPKLTVKNSTKETPASSSKTYEESTEKVTNSYKESTEKAPRSYFRHRFIAKKKATRFYSTQEDTETMERVSRAFSRENYSPETFLKYQSYYRSRIRLNLNLTINSSVHLKYLSSVAYTYLTLRD